MAEENWAVKLTSVNARGILKMYWSSLTCPSVLTYQLLHLAGSQVLGSHKLQEITYPFLEGLIWKLGF